MLSQLTSLSDHSIKAPLERLVLFIRHADQKKVSQVIAIIRSDASNERILNTISEGMGVNDDTNQGGLTEVRVQHR